MKLVKRKDSAESLFVKLYLNQASIKSPKEPTLSDKNRVLLTQLKLSAVMKGQRRSISGPKLVKFKTGRVGRIKSISKGIRKPDRRGAN